MASGFITILKDLAIIIFGVKEVTKDIDDSKTAHDKDL